MIFSPLSQANPTSRSRPTAAVAGLLAALWLISSGGCSRPLETKYGESTGAAGSGINGFATLRQSFEQHGWKTQSVRRLTPRVRSLDALVWTPNDYRGHPIATITWLQDWLAEAPRTLIYVLPDEGGERHYWQQARELAPAGQRLEYRRRYAAALSETLNGPFHPRRNPPAQIDHLWFQAQLRRGDWPRWEILPPSSQPPTATPSSQSTATNLPTIMTTPTTPTNFDWLEQWDDSDYRLEDDELQRQTVASNADGLPLIVRLFTPQDASVADAEEEADTLTLPDFFDEDDVDRWMREQRQASGYGLGESQLLVVSSGSLISNLALTDPEGRRLAESLLQAADRQSPQQRRSIGFLVTGGGGTTVSESTDSNPSGVTGTEHLTVWPLSVVTLHLAFLGLLACLIMLPIFGRPRRLASRPTNDFSEHLRAVGSLLARTGGSRFARQRIDDYHRLVRSDSAAPSAPHRQPPAPAAPINPAELSAEKPTNE